MAVEIQRQFWPDQQMTPEQVFPLQDRWAKMIVERPLPAPPMLIAGCDVHLRGNHEPVGEEKGATAPLVFRGQVVGMALRSKDRVKPLFISVGYLITLDEAVEYVLRCCLKHRLPEPTRLAHVAAQSWARGEVE